MFRDKKYQFPLRSHDRIGTADPFPKVIFWWLPSLLRVFSLSPSLSLPFSRCYPLLLIGTDRSNLAMCLSIPGQMDYCRSNRKRSVRGHSTCAFAPCPLCLKKFKIERLPFFGSTAHRIECLLLPPSSPPPKKNLPSPSNLPHQLSLSLFTLSLSLFPLLCSSWPSSLQLITTILLLHYQPNFHR